MLPQLFVSEPKGVKRKGVDPVPEDWMSVQENLQHILLARRRLNAPVESLNWTDKIPFRFAPADQGVMAEFALFFKYDREEVVDEDGADDGIPFTKIWLGEPSESCVEATLRNKEQEEVLVVDRLWYARRDEADRPTCGFLHVGEKGRKGEGAILLGALLNIAAAFGIEKIELTDEAKFHAASAPIWGNVDVTDYLRKVRGYGQYEGLGFFGRTPKNAQWVLAFNNTLMTTPVMNLSAENVSHDVLSMLRTNTYVTENPSLSMREIVLNFEDAIAGTDIAVLDLQSLGADLFVHFEAANAIVKSTRLFQSEKFPNTTRSKLTKTLTFNGGGAWGWEVVATEGSPPEVQRELLRDEYTFPGVLEGKFAEPPKTRQKKEFIFFA